MRIRKSDCDSIINRITPNSISYNVKVIEDRIEVTTDFRTHDKYAKRLYYAFKPLWYILHAFDWALMDRVDALAKLSFGFSTLTVYPAAGANSPCDGMVYRSGVNETLSTIRSSAGTGSSVTDTNFNTEMSASATTNQYGYLYRSIMCFDTSPLTSGATISAAVLSLICLAKGNALGSPDLHIAGATPAATNTLASSDYGQCQTTSFGSIAYASINADNATYNDVTQNASGIANISKTGISKFSAQLSWDILNSAPWISNQATYLYWRSADNTGTSIDPKLVVTYTVAVGPANLKTYNTNLSANIKTVDTNAIANVKTLDTNA